MSGFSQSFDEDPLSYSIEEHDEGGRRVVRLSGEMDLRASTDLRETLLKGLTEGSGSIVLDLAELSFIDSTIISVLIMARKRADAAEGRVELQNVPARIQRILAITGIDTLFPVAESAPAPDAQ